MKRISIYTTIISLALISGLSSCLKDTTQPDFAKDKPVIELPIGSSAANGGGNSIAASFKVSSIPSDYFFYVNYAAPDAASQNVTVTLAVDTSLVTKFNKINGTDYAKMIPAYYTLASNKVVIPAGQHLAKLPIKINTINLDADSTYALPIKIIDGNGFTISGNFGSLIAVINLKNKWDGVYTVTGTMNDTQNSTLTGAYPITMQLVTQGSKKDAISYSGSFAHGILSGTSITTYGSFSPVFTIDKATNTITGATNYYVKPDNGRDVRMDLTGENKFTMSADGNLPVTLKVKYVMTQGGDRTFFDETWTYTGERP